MLHVIGDKNQIVFNGCNPYQKVKFVMQWSSLTFEAGLLNSIKLGTSINGYDSEAVQKIIDFTVRNRWIETFLGTIAQFKDCDLRHRKILYPSFADFLKKIQLPSKEEDTDTCVEKVMHQKLTSLFLKDLLALMSATISSADMSEAKPPKES